MKGFFTLLRRFVPPYKGWAVSNIIFNILGAVFGAFSFLGLNVLSKKTESRTLAEFAFPLAIIIGMVVAIILNQFGVGVWTL